MKKKHSLTKKSFQAIWESMAFLLVLILYFIFKLIKFDKESDKG